MYASNLLYFFDYFQKLTLLYPLVGLILLLCLKKMKPRANIATGITAQLVVSCPYPLGLCHQTQLLAQGFLWWLKPAPPNRGGQKCYQVNAPPQQQPSTSE